MELKPLYRCVAALDVHQSKLTVCVLYEDEAGETQVELREFGGFKRDRKAMGEWVASFRPQQVVMESTGIYWQSPYAAREARDLRSCRECPSRQAGSRSQDRSCRCAVVGHPGSQRFASGQFCSAARLAYSALDFPPDAKTDRYPVWREESHAQTSEALPQTDESWIQGSNWSSEVLNSCHSRTFGGRVKAPSANRSRCYDRTKSQEIVGRKGHIPRAAKEMAGKNG